MGKDGVLWKDITEKTIDVPLPRKWSLTFGPEKKNTIEFLYYKAPNLPHRIAQRVALGFRWRKR